MQRVKAPPPPLGAAFRRPARSAGSARGFGGGVATALICAILTSVPGAAAADEPLCSWLSGIGEAAQSLAEGRAETSELAARRALAARPRGAAGARASAALGLALVARGEPVAAADALERALAAPTAPARPYLAHARGHALAAAGQPQAAARLHAEASRAGELALARRAQLAEAQALLAAGLPEEAATILEAFLRAHPTDQAAPAARLALAAARRSLGDAAGAVDGYRAVWLEADREEAAAAGAALDAWRSRGGPVPPASIDDHLARADRLVQTARPDEALAELSRAVEIAAPEPAPPRVSALRAVALLALGRHADAQAVAEAVAATRADTAEDDVHRTARWVLARVAARAGRVEDATRGYAEVAVLPGRVLGLPEWRQQDVGDESAFLAAWLHYDAGAWARAAEALDAFARANPRSRRVDDARWFAAWSQYQLGRKADAARAFAGLARGPLADAAAYWQARATPEASRRRGLYRTALSLSGDGWYGLLARARLAEMGERPPRPALAPARPLPETAPAAASPRLAVAVELLALGLEAEALEALGELARTKHARAAAPLVGQLAAYAGDAELPFRMARDHLGTTRRTARWARPEPYPELLEQARSIGVDPALLLAIMRRESAFRRAVRSSAGAEGLLQLLPMTADRIAAMLGLEGGAGARLAEPEVSVPLGAHYLALLEARFEEPAVVVAAYNAGPRAVAEWARARAGVPLDEWVESIPFRETRHYVKIVLPDWHRYRELAGEPPPRIDPGLPIPAPGRGVAF